MPTSLYRVESAHPMFSRLLPMPGQSSYAINERSVAIAVAAKSVTQPQGEEVRVVHIASGEVVYRKTAHVFSHDADN